MTRTLAVIALAGLTLAAPASAYDIAQNGGFETGSLSGWQIFNQGASGGTGSWYAHTSGNGSFSGLPTSPPAAGSWQAVADNNGRAAAILYQDVTIPSTTRAVISFVLWYGNAAPGGYVNGTSLNPGSTNQRVRIDLITPATNLLTTSGALSVVHASASGSPAIFNPTTISQDVTAFAGQTIRLRVALVGTNGPIIAGIDQVKLEVSPFVPFPQSFVGLTQGAAHWGDFDSDGQLEVVRHGTNLTTPVWEISRFNSGNWVPYAPPLMTLVDGASAIGDLDRDGDLDLAGVGSTAARLRDLVVYRQDGLMNFTSLPQPGNQFSDPGSRHGSLEWGDIDNDGDLDGLMTGFHQSFLFESPTTVILRNDGAATFTPIPLGIAGSADGNARFFDPSDFGFLGAAVCGNGVTELYANDGLGGLVSLASGLPGITNGDIAVGDLDNDGSDDFVITGLNGSTRITRVYGSSTGPVDLIGVSESSLSLGDFDHDGWSDIALCGFTGSTRVTRIYRNNGNGTFTDIAAGLPGVGPGNVEWGDFESDGDLDLLIQGDTGSGLIGQIFLNGSQVPNAAPTPPADLFHAWYQETGFQLSHLSFGTDDHTPFYGLTNNYRAGTSPGAPDIVSPMSDATTGQRRVPRPGQSFLSNVRHLPLTSMGHGPVHWSVQSVDQGYQGSPWAPEQVIVVGPQITQVQDIPQDQGGRVRLTLSSSPLDDAERTHYLATGYNVWRLVPGTVAETVAREGVALAREEAGAVLAGGDAKASIGDLAATNLPLVSWQGRHFTPSDGITVASPFPAGTWEIVGSFFAAQQPGYVVATTTVADSGMSGPNDATFIVTVHTTTPTIWFASPPATGRSIDNLKPAAPTSVIAEYHTGQGNHLHWDPSPEPDFHEFRIHRHTTPSFIPDPSTLVATVTTPEWTDPAHDAPGVYYYVATVDHAGNHSSYVGPEGTVGVEPGAGSVAFMLADAVPNPFRLATRIGFALPEASRARLQVFDIAGRLVLTLVDRSLPAGEHEASWDGRDRSGGRARAGLYFYRLEAGPNSVTRRVVLGR